MYFSNFSALAPLKLSICSPFLMKTKVGMDEMLYRIASSSQSSTSTYNECIVNRSHFVSSDRTQTRPENRDATSILRDNAATCILLNAHLNDDNLIGVCIGELFQLGRNHFAGTAPGCVEIDQNQEVSCRLQLLVEVGL